MNLVTIGIPTYNVGRFIALSLKSVLAQTYTNFELIITDDGSTDNTVEEIRKFNDPRIKVIVDGKNHGISYRLNQQIDMAKGEIFVRMDGDDLMFPTRVEEQVRYLLEHPDVDVVGGQAIIIGDNNELLGYRGSKLQNLTFEALLSGSCFIHPTVAGRIGFFKKFHYDENMSGVEDHHLWLRGFNDGKYDWMDKPVLFYRDPLVFKLSTYLYRQKRLRSAYRQFECLLPAYKTTIFKCIVRSYVKTILSSILSFLHQDKRMIAKRNKAIESSEVAEYQKILDKVRLSNI